MKQLVLGVMLVLGSATVAAETPLADQRQENQEQRIEQGVATGEVTKREEARLDAQQERVENKEARIEADGVVTKRERVRLQRSQDRASANVAKQKHDRQDKD